jgi:site-specific recombinase XerD
MVQPLVKTIPDRTPAVKPWACTQAYTVATMLLLQGVTPKVVSEIIGHSAISMALDLYSHVLPDMQKEAADPLKFRWS